MTTLFLVLAFAIIHSVLPAPVADDLIVSLPDGQVQGTTYTTPNNKTFYGFQGIPFATPPVDNLRFAAPKPPQPWTGVMDGTKDSKGCVTSFNFLMKSIESEDCLYVTVYTPTLQTDKKLPVMVWIYGGKFILGSARKTMYGPEFLMDEDVIMVTANYRLGPLGFLSTGDSEIVGNAGLKDQALAIKWAHENIQYFGGDPEKITIFGESAGGASVGLQLVSKSAAGLFRGAIAESGSALTNWTIDLNPKAFADLLTTKLGGETYLNDTKEMKKFLLERSAGDIANAADLLGYKNNRVSGIMDLLPINQAWPVVEVENEDAFLTESPYELLDSGRFNQVPIIIGLCANEAGMFLQDEQTVERWANTFDTIPSTIIPPNLRPNSSDVDEVVKRIKSMYLKEGETFSSNHVAMTNLGSDQSFGKGIIKQAELSSKYVPVYLYQFANANRALFPFVIPGAEKAAHGSEIAFIFKVPILSDTTDPDDILTQNRMVKFWTNFAKYLNPTPEKSELIDLLWPTFTTTELQYLNINATLEIRSNVRDNFEEWNNIYQTYGKKPLVTF